MTNAELIAKIKAEIERRLKDYWKICFHDVKAYNEDSNVRELKELLSFLSTLESEKPVPADLEEAALEYAPDLPSYNIGGGYLPPQSRDDLRTAFKDGAKWQKEQILKNAVEGEVYKFGEVAYVKERSNAELTKYLSQFNNGDKVKIIVIHETDIR